MDIEKYRAFLKQGEARRDRIHDAAKREPRPYGKLPRATREVGGYKVVMTKIRKHAEHGLRLQVLIRNPEGDATHDQEHFVVNPPTACMTRDAEGKEVRKDDPLFALARVVLNSSRNK